MQIEYNEEEHKVLGDLSKKQAVFITQQNLSKNLYYLMNMKLKQMNNLQLMENPSTKSLRH